MEVEISVVAMESLQTDDCDKSRERDELVGDQLKSCLRSVVTGLVLTWTAASISAIVNTLWWLFPGQSYTGDF